MQYLLVIFSLIGILNGNAVERGVSNGYPQYLIPSQPVIPLNDYRRPQPQIQQSQYQSQSYNRFGNEPAPQNIQQNTQTFQYQSVQMGSNPPAIQTQHQFIQSLNGQTNKGQYQSQNGPPQQFTNSHQIGPVKLPPKPVQPAPQPQPTSIPIQSVNRGNVAIAQEKPTFQTLYPNYQTQTQKDQPQVFDNRFSFNEGAAYEVNTPEQRDQILRIIAPAAENFALDFFSVVSRSPDDNFMISPYSIWSLLVLLSEGASGKTFNQIQTKLQLPDSNTLRKAYKLIDKILSKSTEAVRLSTFQALVTDKNRPVKKDYETLVTDVYDSDLVPVDFLLAKEAYNTINEYASNKTNGNIQKIVKPSDILQAQMILLSGIHFEGQWKFPFNTSFTREENFYDVNETPIGRVQMMFHRGPFPYVAIADLECHVIELPYGHSNELSMIVMLPRKGLDLKSAIENLKRVGLQKIINELNKSVEEYEDEEAEIFLPRFTTLTQFNLVEGLKIMGITDLFDSDSANLEKIVANKSLYVSSLIQKTKIQVNEEGTIASAITAAVLSNKSAPPRFYANRPFAYMIVDKTTNMLLFCGQYSKPSL